MKEKSKITDLKLNILKDGVSFSPLDLFTNYNNIKKYKTKRIKTRPTIIDNEVYDMAEETNLIPSEILLSSNNRSSIVKLRYNSESPIRIELNNDELKIYDNEKLLDMAGSLVKEYEIMQEETPFVNEGIKTKIGDYVDVVGIDRLSILFFEGCYNWSCGKACKFCDLHPKSMSDRVVKPSINKLKLYDYNVKKWWDATKDEYFEGIKYSIKKIENEIRFPHKHLFFMAGNLPTCEDVWNVAEETIQNMSTYLKLDEYDSYLNIAPHDTIERLIRVKEIGIKQVQYNLEIANKTIFEDTCPGKLKYDLFVAKLEEAVSVFGFGNVRSNFVFGLQDKDEMLKELERLAKLGIVADYSVFQPKSNTPFQNLKSPDFADVIDFSNKLVDIYIKYGFKPIFCSLSSRSSVVNELYEDRC